MRGSALGIKPRPLFALTIEGQAVRTWVGVAVLIGCLGLTGCSLFGKKQSARTANPKPFTGAETPAQREPAAVAISPGRPLPGANGMLAGQIVSEATRKPVKAVIRVKNLEEDEKGAPLDVETNEAGYFTIPGLKVGGHYQLIPRSEDGGKLASQMAFATPPNPALYIQVDKKYTTSSTPPLPAAPTIPGKKGTTATESSQERSPAASLDTPIRIAPGSEPPPSRAGAENPPAETGVGASQGGGNPPNISNVAEGFRRVPANPDVNIQYRNTPSWPAPPKPRWEGVQEDRPPQSNLPPAVPSSTVAPLPSRETPVPSCVLLGNKLDNFALKDLNGQTWEYRRNHTGRLVLLDFWYSSCTGCLHAIPHLNELQKSFGQYGLEVIGIAAEPGTVEQQVRNVMSVRGRYSMSYRTLLSGGGPHNCPVVNQFRVEKYPTLFLLDATGTIVWHSGGQGMDDYAWKTLEREIAKRLIQQR